MPESLELLPELQQIHEFIHTHASKREALPFPHGYAEVISLFLAKINPEYTTIFGEMKLGFSITPFYHAWNKHSSGVHVDLAARCFGPDEIKIFKPYEGIYSFDADKQIKLYEEKKLLHQDEINRLMSRYRELDRSEVA